MAFRPLKAFGGLLDRMVPVDNYGGLLSAQDQRAAGRDARMMLASGLLSAAGPQRMPVSLGQAIGGAMPAAMQARDYRAETGLRNDQLRRQIDNENRQNAARTKFSGLLRGAGGPDGELLGLLADLDPALAVQAMSGGNDRADPAALREMQALGFPLTQDGFVAYNAAKAQSQGGDLATQLLIDERQARLDAANREAEQSEQDRAAARTSMGNTLERSLDQTAKIVQQAEVLEDSFLQVGLPAADYRRATAGVLVGLGSALGLDVEKLEAEATAFDTLKKNLADQVNNLLAAGNFGDNTTDSKLRQVQSSLASAETSMGAIRGIQANISEILLDEADAQKIEIPNRAKIEGNIEAWRSYSAPESDPVIDTPAVVRRAADIGRMSLEQLQQLNPASLTKELRDAAADRWDELNAQ